MATNPASPTNIGFSLQTWRENFLRLVMRGTLIVGVFALIPAFLTNSNPFFLTIYAVAYLVLVLVTFAPLPYALRAGIFITLFFILGLSGLLETGIWGDSRVFFVGMVVITGMLLSPRAAIWATGITLIATGLMGWLVITGQYQIDINQVSAGGLDVWLSASAGMLMLDAVMIIGLSLFQDEFTKARERANKSLADLQQEQILLEQRVEERTKETLEKANQLEAASSVARNIAEIRDLQTLLNTITNNIAEQFMFYHVGIFLLDDNQQYAVLQAVSSEGGKEMLASGHRLGVGQTGIVGYATGRGRPRVALDTGTDAVFFDNPHLPLTHSEMALPLLVRGRVIGALDIQSEKTNAFNEGDIEIMQTVADQLAIAIENARLFSETEAIIGQFQALNALQTQNAWSNYLKRRSPAYRYTTLGVRPLTEPVTETTEGSLRIPLELRGQEIGVINLLRKDKTRAWTTREREIAREIANQAALALDTSRLLEETQKGAARDQMVANVSNRFRETLDMDSVLQTAAEELRKAFGLLEAEVRLNPLPTEPKAVPAPAGKTKKKTAGSNGRGDQPK